MDCKCGRRKPRNLELNHIDVEALTSIGAGSGVPGGAQAPPELF